MKVNKFVKKVGWERAKELVNGLKVECYANGVKTVPAIVLDNGETWINYDDLKTLVESYDLVQEYGGLSEALEFIKYAPAVPEIYELRNAIEEVESCNE